jgi:hypothetical protein
MRKHTLLLLAVTAQLGCLQQLVPAHSTQAPSTVHSPILPGDIFDTLKDPAGAHAELCANDGSHPNFPNDADQITKAFCQDLVPGGAMPTPSSLADLLKLLNLEIKDPAGGNGTGGNPGFAILGHSSALTARKVTTVTPTVFIFTPPPADGSKPAPGYVFLAYDPGEQFVEVASHDPVADAVNFYLVRFDKECDKQPGGCTNSDLLTQNLITGWSNVREYESSTSLNNTLADCRQCHAPVDANPQFLRMQEIEAPFTHWFSMKTEGGKALYDDFHKMHSADEDYGPLPAALVDKADPELMAKMIKQAGFGDQPNAFPSAKVEGEIALNCPGQPVVNSPRGWSQTWQGVYNVGAAGQAIAAPYHDVKVTDPDKLSKAVTAWQQWKSGMSTILPDIRDVFLDDGLREMGFAPRADATGAQLLQQMCEQCHHSNLDLTLSRQNFLVDKMQMMSRAEKDLAIDRLRLPDDQRLAMPPVLFRSITDQERQLMIDELSK